MYRLCFFRNWSVEKLHQPPGSPEPQVERPRPRGDDRRVHTRYPLRLTLHYTVLQRRRPLKRGDGRTVNLSSAGVHFVIDGSLPLGNRIELVLDWPLLLDGYVPLKLIALGKVVWVNGDNVGLHFLQHESRTRGAGRKLA